MSEATIPVQAAAPPRLSEDLVAVGLGLGVFLLALLSLLGADALGWLVTTSVWTDPSTALAPVSKAYASLGGGGALLVTYLILTAVLSAGAYLLGDDVRRFALAFTAASPSPTRAGSSALGRISPRSHRLTMPSSASRGRSSSRTKADTSSRSSQVS
jgi:hypothetical protein